MKGLALALLVVAAGLAGCSTGGAPPATIPTLSLVLVGSSPVPCKASCHEPTLVVTQDGVFVTAGRQPVVWHMDAGWRAISLPSIPDGMTGGDNLLTARAAGGFHVSHLIQPRDTQGLGQLLGLGVHGWHDGAWVHDTVWFPGQGVIAPLVDRQWLTEMADGELLLSYSQIGAGIWLATSGDGGTTWTPFDVFASVAQRQNAGGQAGAPHRLPSGAVAIPMNTSQGLALAVRPEAGETELRVITTAGTSGLPQIAVQDGLVFAAWGDAHKFVSVSVDEGRSWSPPVDLGDDFTPGSTAGSIPANASPWIAAQGDSIYVLGLKGEGPWLARLWPDGTVQASWMLDATLPDDGNTDHAHFAFGPDGLPCMTWSNDVTVSVACLRETTTDKA